MKKVTSYVQWLFVTEVGVENLTASATKEVTIYAQWSFITEVGVDNLAT